MIEKTSEEKVTALRERIEASLRARDTAVGVFSYDAQVTVCASGATKLEALRSVANAVGLDADGNDRRIAELRAENERLTRERDAAIADAASMRDTLYRAAGHACPACGYVAVCK